MVLYQRRSIPFILRLAAVILHPGMVLLLAVPAGIFYFAIHEKSSMATAMYIAVAVISLFILLGYYFIIKQIISRIVLIEAVPEGLRVDQLKYDQHNDVIIPTRDIDVEIGTYRGRRSRRTTYHLYIRQKGNAEISFSLQEDPSVIGRILDGIEKQKLISLRAKEKDFLDEYRKGLMGTAGFFNMAIRLVILGVIAYYLYSNRTTLLNLYNNLNALRSPVTGYWKVKAGDLIFEVDLLTDSSFNETLFGKGGKWRLASGTTSDHFGELIFYNEENAFNTFSILNLSDSILMLQGKNDQHQVILSKMKTSERMPVDSVTRFLACFDPALPIPPSSSSIKETIDAIIPEKAGLLPVEMLIKNDTLAVATLSDPKDGWNTYVVVINPLLKLRLELNALPHGNACDATHKINFLKGRPVVVQNTVCTEASNAEKTTQCFTLEETGKLSETSCEGIAGASRLNQ